MLTLCKLGLSSWWFQPILLSKQLPPFSFRKATTWLYLPCSWPVRFLTCLSSSGLQHCWKVHNDFFLALVNPILGLLFVNTNLRLCKLLTVRMPWLCHYLWNTQSLFSKSKGCGWREILTMCCACRLKQGPWEHDGCPWSSPDAPELLPAAAAGPHRCL